MLLCYVILALYCVVGFILYGVVLFLLFLALCCVVFSCVVVIVVVLSCSGLYYTLGLQKPLFIITECPYHQKKPILVPTEHVCVLK